MTMSQSLWNRAVSFDTFIHGREWQMDGCLNPFGTGQCLSTDGAVQSVAGFNPSQSLWNRAVSFDCTRFEVLRDSEVSIPLEQGSVFRQQINLLSQQQKGLNPFGTGQCLSTTSTIMVFKRSIVSIPLEQGSVFRPYGDGTLPGIWYSLNPFGTGQCLSTLC